MVRILSFIALMVWFVLTVVLTIYLIGLFVVMCSDYWEDIGNQLTFNLK